MMDYWDLIERGRKKINLDMPVEAIEDFQEAIRINPDEADAFAWRGYAKIDLKQYQEAIEDFTRAIKINPDYAFAYHGDAKASLEQYQEAIEDYTRATRLLPDYSLFKKRLVDLENIVTGNSPQSEVEEGQCEISHKPSSIYW